MIIMSVWFSVWLALAGAVGFMWIVRYAAISRVLRRRRVLSSRTYPSRTESSGEVPKVSIVVAAKDEEDNIEACVRGLLEQDYPSFELIVVDDRSKDRTPAILQRLAEDAGSQLRLVTVKTLSVGWFGKNNAMREGVARSCGEWLLFTDADCRQTSRKTLSTAMHEALAEEADFLSITPVLETRTVWERIIQPVCSMALMMWFLPHRVNKRKTKTAYANGAFMLMRRSCYDAIGGHERVRTEVNEDIHMARLAKQMGLRLWVVENDDLYRTRMYDSPRAAWRGWSRIFYGCLGSLTRLSAAVFLLIVFSILPWVSLIVAGFGRITAETGVAGQWTLAVWAWLAVILLEQFVVWRLYALLRAAPGWSLAYMVGALVTLAMLVNAMFKVSGATKTTWRGTSYRGRRLEEEPPTLPVRSDADVRAG